MRSTTKTRADADTALYSSHTLQQPNKPAFERVFLFSLKTCYIMR